MNVLLLKIRLTKLGLFLESLRVDNLTSQKQLNQERKENERSLDIWGIDVGKYTHTYTHIHTQTV